MMVPSSPLAGSTRAISPVRDTSSMTDSSPAATATRTLLADHPDDGVIGADVIDPLGVETLEHVLRVGDTAEHRAELSGPLGQLEAPGIVDRCTDQRRELLEGGTLGLRPRTTRFCGDGEQRGAPEQRRGDLVAVDRRLDRANRVGRTRGVHRRRRGTGGPGRRPRRRGPRASRLMRWRCRHRTAHGANRVDRVRRCRPVDRRRCRARRTRRAPSTKRRPGRAGGRCRARRRSPAGPPDASRPAATSTDRSRGRPARARRPPCRPCSPGWSTWSRSVAAYFSLNAPNRSAEADSWGSSSVRSTNEP